MKLKIKGWVQVRSKLRSITRQVVADSKKALRSNAIELRKSMEKEFPRTPRKTGDLIKSFYYSPVSRNGNFLRIYVGYTIFYAPIIHNPGLFPQSKTRWTRKKSGSDWFRLALKRHKKVFNNIVISKVRIR